VIEDPYSKFLTNIAAQKNHDWEASALLKWLPPPLHIASWTGSMYFIRYPVLSCEQNKAIRIINEFEM
jgi:hypothetical protein